MQPIKLAENLRKYGRQNFAIKCVNHANSMSFVVGSFPIKTKIADFFGMLKGNVGPKYGGWGVGGSKAVQGFSGNYYFPN